MGGKARLSEKEAIALGIIKPGSSAPKRDVVAEAMAIHDARYKREPFDWDRGRAELEQARADGRAIEEGVRAAGMKIRPVTIVYKRLLYLIAAIAFMAGFAAGCEVAMKIHGW